MVIEEFRTDAHLDEALNLFKTSLAGDFSHSWFQWKHRENPFGNSLGLIAIENGAMIGIRFFMKWEFRRNDEILTALRPVDTVTHPSARGMGIFTKLTLEGLARFNAQEDHVVFNTPNKNSLPGYVKMGWKKLNDEYAHYYFLRNVFTRLKGEIRIGNFATLDSVRVLHRAEDRTYTTNKSLAFIKWRYQLPEYHYATYIQDSISLVLIYKLISVFGVRVLMVIDYLGTIDKFEELLQAVAKKVNTMLIYSVYFPPYLNPSNRFSIKRGESNIVIRESRYGDVPVSFSPGDLQGVL